MIFALMLLNVYDIISIFNNAVEREFIAGASALTFGFVGIIYGISLIKLKVSVGRIPKIRWFPGNNWWLLFVNNSTIFCWTYHLHSGRTF